MSHRRRPVALRTAAALFLAAAVVAPGVSAQQPTPRAGTPAPAAPPAPPANPADVKSVDAILAALYDVISGPAGQKRDWNRFASLFYPGARLVPSGPRQGGGFGARVITPEEYAQRTGPLLERDGFFEKEIARKTEQYGNVVHAFSTYESRGRANDPTPFARGINSIQLFNDGTRWWVLSIFWEGERPENPIPAKYLP